MEGLGEPEFGIYRRSAQTALTMVNTRKALNFDGLAEQEMNKPQDVDPRAIVDTREEN